MHARVRASSFFRGFLAASPLIPGVVVFGLLYGVTARTVPLSPAQTAGMSAIVHAGSSQFVALGLWTSSGAAAIILTTLVINLRHLLMGASVAPHLKGLPLRWKMLLALWMSDESYATAIAAYENGIGDAWYFLGANLCIWITWWPSGLAGAFLGQSVPDLSKYGFDMIFPLAFIGLASGFLKGPASAAAAFVAAALAIAGSLWLPGQWYILAAGILGASFGLAVQRRAAA
jgi:4-azaleucine resistance transporter AzlC